MARNRIWPSALASLGVVAILALVEVRARCPNTRNVSCDSSTAKFRTFDGSCNNREDPSKGMANTPLIRILESRYADGIHEPRRAKSGKPLPSARRLVTTLFKDKDIPSKATNILVMTWAQLLSHDAARIQAPFPRPNARCCEVRNTTDTCDRVPVPDDDPFYSRFDVKCIGVDRSASAPCKTKAHEQNSLVTHFLDASFVYGSNMATAQRLREGKGGRLRTQIIQADEFLPRGPDGSGMMAGDARVTITPMLAALQTLFLREHNRVARKLSAMNSHWSDERTYQEAKRIVVAEWQLLTYRDWLQWIIGSDEVEKEGLMPSLEHSSRDYDPAVDPTTANDFTTAAYRSFHSMVADDVWLGGGGDEPKLARRLLSDIGAEGILTPRVFRRVVLGQVFQPRQAQDQFMADEITNKLFRGRNAFGGDLVSTDIQRGREHGLPGYNEYRQHCNLQRATAFEHFNNTISAENIAALRALYEHPDDVDVVVGGLLEQIDTTSPLASVTSPVFRCIVADQFRRWRKGDRFFFDLAGQPTSFTAKQLASIGKQSMSRMICDNVPGVRRIPRDAFLNLDVLGNAEADCSDLPSMDFSPWRETRRSSWLG